MISTGMVSIPSLQDRVIRLFALCGRLQEADQVFSRCYSPSLYTWHSLISAHVAGGDGNSALLLYKHMLCRGIEPDRVVLLSVLKACANLGRIHQGRMIHDCVVVKSFDHDCATGSSLIEMYARSGSLDEAQRVFDSLSVKDVVTWSSLINAYVHHGYGYPAFRNFIIMHQKGVDPDKFVFSNVLKACGMLKDFEKCAFTHDCAIRRGFESDAIVGSALIDMYVNCKYICDACAVFDSLSCKTVASWNTMIAGYVQHRLYISALLLYEKMNKIDIVANNITFLSVLKACSSLMIFTEGRTVHDQIIKYGLENLLPIQNALIDLYAKSGSMQEMSRIFNQMLVKDTISWNTMIAGFADHGHNITALSFFQMMEDMLQKQDECTLSCALKAFNNIMTCNDIELTVEQGRILHNKIVVTGFDLDLITESSLVVMYARFGFLYDARRIFDKMITVDVVAWNTMISTYVLKGESLQGLQLLEKMQQRCLKPSSFTFSCALKACKSMESIICANLLHDQVVRNGFEREEFVATSLVDFYVRFGFLDEAKNIFDRLSSPSLVVWNVIIGGCSQYSDNFTVLELFSRMQSQYIQPDKVTLLHLIQVSNSIGSLTMGMILHDQIVRAGLESDKMIGTSLVDLYAGCGNLVEGQRMLDVLPDHTVASWSALIAGYGQSGNYELTKHCFERMQNNGFNPDGTVYSSVLAACSHSGQVTEGYLHFKQMKDEHGIVPTIEHFNCIIDMLSRSGFLSEAKRFLETMPMLADVSGWVSLLVSCRIYGNVKLGEHCVNEIRKSGVQSPAAYLLLSSIYADAQMWEDVNKIKELKIHASDPIDELKSASNAHFRALDSEGFCAHIHFDDIDTNECYS